MTKAERAQEQVRYWNDFCLAQVLVGTTGAFMYAYTRKAIRADRLAKQKAAVKRRRLRARRR